MVIDKLSEITKYESLHPRFAKAIEFIVTSNLMLLETGVILLDGQDIKVIVIEEPCVAADQALAGFECHNTYIDIQIILKGKETVGWKARTTCMHPKAEYNAEKDVLFYADTPSLFFELEAGMFSIYFPNDVHVPMIGEGVIKKVVIKVKAN